MMNRKQAPGARVTSNVLCAALVCCVAFLGRCTCGPEVEPDEPKQIGEGDPVEPPDAGDPYDVDAGPLLCEEDDLEENDERASARELADGVPATARACGGDDDWYALASAPGCTVIAEVVRAVDAKGDIDTLLFDPDGLLVGSANTLDASDALSVTATKTGLYAARLRAGSREDVPYTVTMTSTCRAELVCPGDDRLEDNDTAATAVALGEGVAHEGILCGVDDDWLLVPVTTGCVADAQLELTSDGGDIDLALYQEDGATRVATAIRTADEERITRVVTSAGMRYRLALAGGDEQNTYRFVVHEICAGAIACPGDDPFEPNDTRAEATELFAAADEAVGVICADDDFYKVTPPAGCTLRARLTFQHAEGDLDLELQQAIDGSSLQTSAGRSDQESIDHVSSDGAPLVLRVSGIANATNAYRLRLDSACP